MGKKIDDKERVSALWENEHRLFECGYEYIAGVDEVGRGPLAGCVCTAAVILPKDIYISGINDSKKLSEKKREQLYDIITQNALAYAVCRLDEKAVDEMNILQATMKAMNNAVNNLDIKPDYVLVDGNRIEGMDIPHETIVGGDAKSISIAAASIIAKVTRDREMVKLSEKYPVYGFDKNKGYGTKEHTKALLEYGPCEIHRKTFLKKILRGTKWEL